MQNSVLNKNKILVIDDDKSLRETLCDIIVLEGFVPIEASGGEEGCEIYKNDKDNIGFVILDLVMPELSGLETFYMLKEINEDIKIIVNSGYDENEDILEMLNNGAIGFLHKPFRIKELISILNSDS